MVWRVQEPEAAITTSSDSNSNNSAEREQEEAGCSSALCHPSDPRAVVCRTDSSLALVLDQSVAFIPFWRRAAAAEHRGNEEQGRNKDRGMLTRFPQHCIPSTSMSQIVNT